MEARHSTSIEPAHVTYKKRKTTYYSKKLIYIFNKYFLSSIVVLFLLFVSDSASWSLLLFNIPNTLAIEEYNKESYPGKS